MPEKNVESEPAGTSRASNQEHVSLRAWLIGSGLALLGILIIVLGGGTFDVVSLSTYWQGVAANAGVAVLLIGPLLVVERAISGQLSRVDARAEAASVDSREAREEVQRVVAATEATLSDLPREVREGLKRVRTRDSRLHERVLEEVTQESLVAIYRRALELSGVDRVGIRAALGNAPIWIRARAFERQEEEDSEPVWLVELLAQRADGSGIGTARAMWSPGEPAPDPFIRLAEALQRASAYPGDDQFDAARILSSLARALQRTIELRTAPTGDRQVRPVAEIVKDDWAVTEFGLDSLRFDLRVGANELIRKPALAWDRLAHDPRLKSEEQQQALRAAFDVAQAFHGGRRRDDLAKEFGTIFRPPR